MRAASTLLRVAGLSETGLVTRRSAFQDVRAEPRPPLQARAAAREEARTAARVCEQEAAWQLRRIEGGGRARSV